MSSPKAKQRGSPDVKVSNRGLLIRRRDHLGSDDEQNYIRAADSLTHFLSRREAYYTEARPLIVNALKAARDTLTRLANSSAPFVTHTVYPESLKSRVLAFSTLTRAVQKFEDRFDKDPNLKAEVKSIIECVSTKPAAEEDDTPGTDLHLSTGDTSNCEAMVASPTAENVRGVEPALSVDPNEAREKGSKAAPSVNTSEKRTSAGPSNKHSLKLLNTSQAAESSTSTSSKSKAGPSTRPKKKVKVNLSRAIDRADALQIDQTDFDTKHHNSASSGLKTGVIVASPSAISSPATPVAASPLFLVSNNIPAQGSGSPSNNQNQWSSSLADTKDLDVVMEDLPKDGGQPTGQIPVFLAMQPGEEMGLDVALSFSVSGPEKDRLHEWKDREKRLSDVEELESSLCLSLMSFTIDEAIDSGLDLNEAFKAPDSAPLMRLRSTWPSNFRLHATIGEKDLFLAPPLIPTPENHVDITSLVSSQDRSNMSVTIHCLCNRTNYTFAILLHPPTQPQLQEWQEARNKELRWRERLRAATTITYESVFGPRPKNTDTGATSNGSTIMNGVVHRGTNELGLGQALIDI